MDKPFRKLLWSPQTVGHKFQALYNLGYINCFLRFYVIKRIHACNDSTRLVSSVTKQRFEYSNEFLNIISLLQAEKLKIFEQTTLLNFRATIKRAFSNI